MPFPFLKFNNSMFLLFQKKKQSETKEKKKRTSENEKIKKDERKWEMTLSKVPQNYFFAPYGIWNYKTNIKINYKITSLPLKNIWNYKTILKKLPILENFLGTA